MRTTRHPLAPARFPPPMHRLPGALRTPEPRRAGPTHPLARDRTLALVEAALFAADEPLAGRKLATVCGLADANEARRQVGRLRELYEREGSSFVVEEIAGGFQLLTRPEYFAWLARLRRHAPEMQLTAAARETLTVVAYRQPITRADVEAVRGVGCAEVLRLLMERGLVKLAGRDDSLGRPALYETTKKFLQLYGLRSLKDLPAADGLVPPSAGEG
ncbi:MAG: SMC-Scp complex subunit ScpB [Gemmataceae bacterium]